MSVDAARAGADAALEQLQILVRTYSLDFLDLGASKGGSLSYGVGRLGLSRGAGVDIDPAKVAKATADGHLVVQADATTLRPTEPLVSAVTALHFLEHLPSAKVAQDVIRAAVAMAADLVYIRQPYFDADDYLARNGLGLFWSNWTGHPNRMTTGEVREVLSELLHAGRVAGYAIYGWGRIADSGDSAVIPAGLPKNQHHYREDVHGPKPVVVFNQAVYRELVAVALVNPRADVVERALKVVEGDDLLHQEGLAGGAAPEACGTATADQPQAQSPSSPDRSTKPKVRPRPDNQAEGRTRGASGHAPPTAFGRTRSASDAGVRSVVRRAPGPRRTSESVVGPGVLSRRLRIGFIEPHLARVGGIRRVLEFGNRLCARGHNVTYYLPDEALLNCTWMPCHGSIKTWASGYEDELDVLIYNHEPNWFLLDRFVAARHNVFYALAYARLYEKPGSWECLRTPVDLVLANSEWTADHIAAEVGVRPLVQLGGANREIFRPYGGPKKYPILTAGDGRRPLKGTATIREAGELLGLPVEEYGPKDLSQPDLGREYDAAHVFVVGSWFEGFCQPGLEALACGVPLVITDNGGCREYAIDGETALVVPPKNPGAMATAIRRLLDDQALADRLVANGLALVARKFDWEQRTDELALRLESLCAGTLDAPALGARLPSPERPELSVIVLAWNNLLYTQRFVESARQHTDLSYELIIVDNGSERDAAAYAGAAADLAVLHPENLGFARGMNAGLEVARGRYVAFCTNDTVLPPGWASTLVASAKDCANAAIVVPAVTQAHDDVTVRSAPGTDVITLPPFSPAPNAVLYLMPTQLCRDLGGWNETYEIASGEDLDLAFTVWANGLDILFDTRVLVEHTGMRSLACLADWKALWARNREHFLRSWAGKTEVRRLDSCSPEVFARNRATAGAAAEWMGRYFVVRDKAAGIKAPSPGPPVPASA